MSVAANLQNASDSRLLLHMSSPGYYPGKLSFYNMGHQTVGRQQPKDMASSKIFASEKLRLLGSLLTMIPVVGGSASPLLVENRNATKIM